MESLILFRKFSLNTAMSKFCILSIDGGGLKGLIAIKILQIIEQITGKKTTELFHLVGGTSTGGLIASALTMAGKDGRPLHDLAYIENMYLEAGHNIFKHGFLTGRETAQLDVLLQKTVGDAKIADAIVPVVVPAYDLLTQRLVVFKTRSAVLHEAKNARLFDICRATSAIPPVFPPYSMRYNNKTLKCVDAGYHIKNPSLAVLAEFWKHRAYYTPTAAKEEDITLISISTGSASGNKKDWSTTIGSILPTQSMAQDYIKQQGLVLDLQKIGFLRVDLHLGESAYSLMKLIEVGDRMDVLAKDGQFHQAVTRLLGTTP
jgi:patatin-like phospholipase/acyl hydrolase